jgi:hypothetical protein
MKLSTAVGRFTDVVDGLDRAVRPETSVAAADTEELVAELIVERDVVRRHLAAVAASFTMGAGVASIAGPGSTRRIIFGGRPRVFLDLDDAIRRLER